MREILFKAKRKDNGKWVEGYYCKLDETTYCIKEDYERNPVPTHHYVLQETMTDWGLPNRFLQFEIDPETLCQYTGLADKNGQKIWENDIVLFEKYKAIIKFEKGQYMMKWLNRTYFRKDLYFFATESKDDIQVIGNVFDNADLLEV